MWLKDFFPQKWKSARPHTDVKLGSFVVHKNFLEQNSYPKKLE